ncbi:MAG: pyridoxal phosphate-dependent aminotransferase [Phycisphaerae bacterium]|nr:pyridoxal phosphate-dependent aminotransferase [Phycisphaerae bacterium]
MDREKETRPLISDRVSHIPTSAIHEMTRLSKEIDDVSFLSWAKPTSGTPEHINKAAIEAIEKGKTGGYTEPSGIYELREQIARKLQNVNHIPASAEEILVTVGAVEGLSAAVMTIIDPGDEVIIPVPGYPTHISQVLMASGTPVCIPTIEQDGFSLNLQAINDAVTDKTRAIMYSDPNNPTGSVYSREELEGLAEIARNNNLVVITDEAYEYFTFDGYKHHSIASFPDMKERVVSAFTFTKTYAMTGWRVGYLHSSPELIPHIRKAHIPFAICAPSVSQYAAIEALKGSQECVDSFRKHYRNARDLMCRRLERLSGVFEYQRPRGSYLMFPRIRLEEGKDSLAFAKRLLKEARVSTTPGVAFRSESHLRMSFCVPEEIIDKAFDRIEDYFQ